MDPKLTIAAMIANYVATRLAMSSAPLDPAGSSQQLHDAMNEGCQVVNDLVFWSDKQLAAWQATGGPLAMAARPTPAATTAGPAAAAAKPAPMVPPVISGILNAAAGVATAAGV